MCYTPLCENTITSSVFVISYFIMKCIVCGREKKEAEPKCGYRTVVPSDRDSEEKMAVDSFIR